MTVRTRGDGGPPARDLSLDEVLEILSNYQRRAIIHHLRDATGTVHSIDELVKHLREDEFEKRGDAPGEDHLLSILVHIHGPKLENAGLIEYDVPSREIRYYPNERVETILERIESAAEET